MISRYAMIVFFLLIGIGGFIAIPIPHIAYLIPVAALVAGIALILGK